ncbi:cilia- and flagella-associated protein 298 [Hylaeus anthracinus]|uniref:cilia- and flagella-associated protein 298 n=1 Tax=Hylaeus anthracinus TaxID=313031 RepID=UPI0023B8E637|nr:cilia- and flagella-associated protein 298 [Hylaeus anthracinus]
MVRLHVKKGEESQFLYDTHVEARVEDVVYDIAIIYNGRLKISRICYEIEELAKHGPMLPHNMMGLTDEQIEELKLKDEWGEKCVPMDGWTFNKDVIGRRNGRQPNAKMREVLERTIGEARAMVSKKLVQQDKLVTQKLVQEALDNLRGAVTIVYPMGLPPHDVIRQEFENTEDLSGTQASLEVIDLQLAQLWFSGKEMLPGKKLKDYLGRNEKTKIIVKLQKRGAGRPAREPVMSEEQRKQLMLHAYNRQEQLKVRITYIVQLMEMIYLACMRTSIFSNIAEVLSIDNRFFKCKRILMGLHELYS